MAKTPNPLTFLLAAIGLAVLILGYGWSHWWWIAVAVCAFATYMCFKKQPYQRLLSELISGEMPCAEEFVTSKAFRTEAAVLAANDPNDYETWSTNAEKMSKIQFEDWAAQFIDAEFTFTGLVERVDELVFEEGFEAIVDFSGGWFDRARLLMNRDQALTVPANSQITFTGTLIEVDTVLGFRLTFINVTFTEG